FSKKVSLIFQKQGIHPKVIQRINSNSSLSKAKGLILARKNIKTRQQELAVSLFALRLSKDPNPLVRRAALETNLIFGKKEAYEDLTNELSKAKKVGPLISMIERVTKESKQNLPLIRKALAKGLYPRIKKGTLIITDEQAVSLTILEL
ncbi:MAG: hypothetical protein PHO61_04035, partial [Candidatus ainarchaeum sp.]|nr:hypothetical protein [Candidatus ainarchaeum sp.]